MARVPEDFGWIHAYDVQQLSLHVGGEQAARATVSPALPEASVEILGAVAGVDRVDLTPQARFTDDLGIDSLTMSIRCSGRGPARVGGPHDEWARFDTVGDVLAYLQRAAPIPC